MIRFPSIENTSCSLVHKTALVLPQHQLIDAMRTSMYALYVPQKLVIAYEDPYTFLYELAQLCCTQGRLD